MNEKKWLNIKKYLKIKDNLNEKCFVHLFNGNRSIGKTFNTLKYFLQNAYSRGEQFILIYRTKSEIKNSSKIFSEIIEKYFADKILDLIDINIVDDVIFKIQATVKKDNNIKTIDVGFSVSLNDCDKVKKYSNIFSKVNFTLLDEFELESGRYLKNEFDKYTSLIFSIARGNGKSVRNINNILLSNNYDIYNPYYLGFGALDKLDKIKKDNLTVKGVGWVIHLINDSNVVAEMLDNKMMSAFSNSNYFNFAVKNESPKKYSNLIPQSYIYEKKCSYIISILLEDKKFSIWKNNKNNNIILSTIIAERKNELIFSCGFDDKCININHKLFNSYKKMIENARSLNRLKYTSNECIDLIKKIFD